MRRLRRRRPGPQQLAYEMLHPDIAVAQALQQSNIGKLRKAGGGSPSARRSQPHAAKAIGQNQPKQIDRGSHRAGTQKGSRFAGGPFYGRHPAKPCQCCLPEFVKKQFVSHATR